MIYENFRKSYHNHPYSFSFVILFTSFVAISIIVTGILGLAHVSIFAHLGQVGSISSIVLGSPLLLITIVLIVLALSTKFKKLNRSMTSEKLYLLITDEKQDKIVEVFKDSRKVKLFNTRPPNSFGTPFETAIITQNEPVLQLIIDHKIPYENATQTTNILFNAIKIENLNLRENIFNTLLENKQVKDRINETNNNNESIIDLANKDPRLTIILINHGAVFNTA